MLLQVCVRRESLVGPRSVELTQSLCQLSWPDLLRDGQSFISSIIGFVSQEAVSLSTDPKSSSVKSFKPPSSRCLPLVVYFLLKYKHIQGLKTGTSVLIYICQAVSAGYCHLSLALAGQPPASSCANGKWERGENTRQTKRSRGSHKV